VSAQTSSPPAKSIKAIRNLLDQLEADVIRPVEPLRGSDPIALAVQLYRARRLRDSLLSGVLFAEPAWDILLDLYVAHHEGRDVSVSSACLAACVPPTTGLRWLGVLEQQGLIAREASPSDSRRVHVKLTAGAIDRMTDVLLRIATTLHG
jgi:DNA-binding MarR family transcriptional regulator